MDRGLKSIPADLLGAAIMALAALLFTLTPLSALFLRVPIGLLMVLFVPGYVLIAALFPKREDLDGIERIALSFGLSIAVVPLIGLGLNYTPWGIRLLPVVISISAFTLLLAATAHWRRLSLPPEERFSLHLRQWADSLKEEIGREKDRGWVDRALTVILLLSIIASIAALVYVVVTPKEGEKFTEFYILGPGGKAYDYPTAVRAKENSTVIVGVVNHEYRLTNYTLQIEVNNTPPVDILLNESMPEERVEDESAGNITSMPGALDRNRSDLVLPVMEMDISLLHNETWERPVAYSLDEPGDRQKLQFLLYKEGNLTAPYRDLHLWVNVSEMD
ncbi:MAG: DUF1616 domain-containing protein [Methanothrix sp.]|jgi:uncharacterized membrane protein|uniref:DUF1616 domain-containing protein n=1 Tax=Methanothrix sp. TaxID=90426 RepID=UPI001BD6933A